MGERAVVIGFIAFDLQPCDLKNSELASIREPYVTQEKFYK